MKTTLQKFKPIYLLVFFIANLTFGQAGFNSTFIVLNTNNSGNTYYDLNAVTANPDFNNFNLGIFCEGNSTGIILKGAEHNVYRCGSCDLTSTAIHYSIYLLGNPSNTFTTINIGYENGSANGCGGEDQRWSDTSNSINVLSGLTPGNYVLEVYSEASTTCSGTIYASNSGANYKANFTVSGFVNYYADNDSDGFGSNTSTLSCSGPPAGYVANNFDCNDNQLQHQDADSDGFGSNNLVACGVTNNSDCNDNQLQYLDGDGDGFGSNNLVACGVTNNSDCNDNQLQYLDADFDGFGSITKVACGVTNNFDCNDNQLQYLDGDGDGFGSNNLVACGVTNNSDCNDNQIQYLDADFDGFGSIVQVACGVVNNIDCNDNQLQYLDADGDGFGSNNTVACGVTNNSDCNDNQLQYLDADFDGFGSITKVACGVTNNIDCNDNQLQYLDADGDGFGSNNTVACGVTNNSDCNDNQLQYLDADFDGFGSTTQVACGVINNIDCNDNQLQYLDADGDGFGSNNNVACGVTNNLDCNDNQVVYVDNDGDSFGSQTKHPCIGVANTTDCNDADANVYAMLSFYVDLDGDLYDDGSENLCVGITIPNGYSTITNGTDCDDSNNAINSGATEIMDNGIDDDCDGITDAYPNCTIPTTWDGLTWSNGNPVADQPAIIAADFTANSDLQACSLAVNNNAQVIVSSGRDFKILGAVSVQDGASLTFENNANLVQIDNTANSGEIVLKRNTSMRRLDYTYWSSPVFGQNLNAFSPLTSTTPSSRFYQLDEPTNSFVSVYSFTTDFELAKGYSVRAPNNFPTSVTPFTGIFTGIPNNGTITIPKTIDGQGFNLIGNPYPSPIDADLFLAQNPGTLYFWTHINQNPAAGANYATYNTLGAASVSGSSVPNGTIQNGQGFLLHTASAGNATFTNSMRIGNNQNQFFRTGNVEKHRFWLNLSNSESPINQILIGYMEGATDGIDIGVDGKIITNSTSLSSRVGDEKYAIQGRSFPFNVNDIVPLNFKSDTEDTYTIAVDHTDGLFENQDIFLKDNLIGTVHDLKETPYVFMATQGNFANRFEVVYQTSPLGISEIFDSKNVIIYKKDQTLHINTGNANMSEIKIYDVRGRLIYENNKVNTSTTEISDLNIEQQMLIVKITDIQNNTITKKIAY